MIVSENHIIATSSKAKSGGWTPDIGVDFFSKGLSRQCCAFLANRLASRLSIFTRVANERGIIVDYIYSSDGASADKGSNCVDRNVAQPAVERENIDGFCQGCIVSCCKRVFYLEQPIRADWDTPNNITVFSLSYIA